MSVGERGFMTARYVIMLDVHGIESSDCDDAKQPNWVPPCWMIPHTNWDENLLTKAWKHGI
jgi:hypothetical protein